MKEELKVNTKRRPRASWAQGPENCKEAEGWLKSGKNFENISQSKHLIGIQIQSWISQIFCTGTQVITYIMRTVLFWVITEQVVVISYWRFGTTYHSHPQGLRIQNNPKGSLNPEDWTNRLSGNVCNKLPLLTA